MDKNQGHRILVKINKFQCLAISFSVDNSQRPSPVRTELAGTPRRPTGTMDPISG